jgi:hypothetical protein
VVCCLGGGIILVVATVGVCAAGLVIVYGGTSIRGSAPRLVQGDL